MCFFDHLAKAWFAVKEYGVLGLDKVLWHAEIINCRIREWAINFNS